MPDPKKKKVVKRKNRVTAVKNADGTTTKTRVRRDGSKKSVKTYSGKKTVASKTVKYRKGGSVKKTLTRPGDGSGTIVKKKNKHGQVTDNYNRKKRVKAGATALAKFGLSTAATISSGAIVPIAKAAGYGGMVGAGLLTAKGVNNKLKKLRKAKPIKSMQNAANWMKKGIKNKIQTGNRKGKTKK